MDDDLEAMSRAELIGEVRRLRSGIREHRDASGQGIGPLPRTTTLLQPEGPSEQRVQLVG